MAKTYTAPTTIAVGDALTASLYNTYVGTNVANLIVPPSLRLERGTTLSIANGTDTLVTWPTEVFDTDGMYTAISDTITVQTAGIYQINTTVEFSANTSGIRVVSLLKNPASAGDGSSRLASTTVQATSSSGGNCVISCSTIASLVATDTIKVHVYHSAGTAVNVASTGSPLQTNVSMAWIGRTS